MEVDVLDGPSVNHLGVIGIRDVHDRESGSLPCLRHVDIGAIQLLLHLDVGHPEEASEWHVGLHVDVRAATDLRALAHVGLGGAALLLCGDRSE